MWMHTCVCVSAWDERVNMLLGVCVCVLMCTPLLLAFRALTEKGAWVPGESGLPSHLQSSHELTFLRLRLGPSLHQHRGQMQSCLLAGKHGPRLPMTGLAVLNANTCPDSLGGEGWGVGHSAL